MPAPGDQHGQHLRCLLVGRPGAAPGPSPAAAPVSTASTFWLAAVFIAEATPASVHLPFLPRCWVNARFSSDTRATEPLPPNASGAEPDPWAETLFQLTIVPVTGVCDGSIPCGWPWGERYPRHWY